MNRINQNVRYLRESANQTKSWVAEQLGKTATSIADYEKGRATPPPAVMQQYADLFGVYVGDLIGMDMWKGESRPPEADAMVKELDRTIREKALLHGTIEEQAAKLGEMNRRIVALAKELARQPGKTIESGDLAALIEILEK